MFSTNSLLIFLIFLGLLSVYSLNEAEKDAGPSKRDSKKRNGAVTEKINNNVENTADKVATDVDPNKLAPQPAENATQPCNCAAPGADAEKSNNGGYGAGSIFVGILFGMGLMFALSQLYVFWEKRRLGDAPAYRGY